MTRCRRFVMGLLMVLALVGCTSSPGPPEAEPEAATSAPTVQISATLVQDRYDEGTRNITIRLTNAGRTSFAVTSVVLDWGGRTEMPPDVVKATYEPGRTIDLPSRYGRPRCDEPSTRPAQVVVGVVGSGDVRVRLDAGGQAWLARLNERDCGLLRVAEAASVGFGQDFATVMRGGEEYVEGSIVIERNPASSDRPALTVTGLGGSVLLEFRRSPASQVLELSPTDDALRIPVLMGSSGRCDGHARGESKQTFLLGVFVRLDGERGPPHRVLVTPELATQKRLLAVIDRACT